MTVDQALVERKDVKNLDAATQNISEASQAKLQEKMQQLQARFSKGFKVLSNILADVTRKVDDLDHTVEKERESRRGLEASMQEMCHEQSDMVKQLTIGMDDATAALKVELAMHSRSTDEMRANMVEALAALKEQDKIASTLRDDLQMSVHDFHEALKLQAEESKSALQLHTSKMSDLELQLRDEFRKAMDDCKESIYQLFLQEGLDKMRAGLQEENRAIFKQMEAEFHNELRTLKREMEGTKATVEDTHQASAAFADKLQSLWDIEHRVEKQLKEMVDSQKGLNGHFHEVTKTKNAVAAVEGRVSHMEACFTEMSCRTARSTEALMSASNASVQSTSTSPMTPRPPLPFQFVSKKTITPRTTHGYSLMDASRALDAQPPVHSRPPAMTYIQRSATPGYITPPRFGASNTPRISGARTPAGMGRAHSVPSPIVGRVGAGAAGTPGRPGGTVVVSAHGIHRDNGNLTGA